MKNFNEYLMRKHSELYPNILDDDLPDAYQDWIGDMEIEDCMAYADEFAHEYALEKTDAFKILEKRIKQQYGTRCKYKYFSCPCCLVWEAFDTLKEALYE